MSSRRGKRAFDVAVGSALLVVSLPVQAAVAGAVRVALGGPVLFRQQRTGRGGRPFAVLKFRTMRPVDPDRGQVSDAERLTPFGRWLRSTSLDELPSLWNVVRGDMSLVGPRPLPVAYDALYSPEQRARFLVRPGVTGVAQVSGRNALDWDTRLALDAAYARDPRWRTDFRVLAKTVGVVLRRSGVTAPGHATMPPFTGSDSRQEAPDEG